MIEKMSLDKINDIQFQLAEFKQRLDQFKRQYLQEKNGHLTTTHSFINPSKANAYRALLQAHSEACTSKSMDPINMAITHHSTAIGLYDYFKSDFANYCATLQQRLNTIQVVSRSNPKKVRRAVQKDGYRPIESDINVGLSRLALEYETKKSQNPNASKLTFLPILLLGDMTKLIPNMVKSRASQSYLGILNYGNKHYAFYFIHKWPNGKISIVLVDSAYSSQHKTWTLKKSEQIFKNLFPGCDVVSLDVIQQFNHSDCGICVLQTAEDVVNNLIQPTDNAFLKFTDKKLLINPLALTLNAEKFPNNKKEMLRIAKETRNKWEKIFSETKEWLTITPQLEDLQGPGYALLNSGPYDFSLEKQRQQSEELHHLILNEFKQSKYFKLLVKDAKKAPADLDFHQTLLSALLIEFRKNSKQVKTYNKNNFEDTFPGELEKFLVQEISVTVIKPILMQKLAELFLRDNQSILFPENTFVDMDGNFQQLTQKFHVALQTFLINPLHLNILNCSLYSDLSNYLYDETLKYTQKIQYKITNLAGFNNTPLTYAMLKQCIEIWRHNHLIALNEPQFIKKLKKLLENRQADLPLDAPLTDEIKTSLKVIIQRWRNSTNRNSVITQIVNALESTPCLQKEKIKVDKDQTFEMTLEQVEKEVKASASVLSNKDSVLEIVEALKFIQAENLKPDHENKIFENYKIYSKNKDYHNLLKVPGEVYIHFEHFATWEQAKNRLNDLVQFFLAGYAKAKQKNQALIYLKKISSGDCVEGRTLGALTWAGRLESLERFDDIMERANFEAEHYLVSINKSLSFENKLNFIFKNYQGLKCLYAKFEKDPLKKTPFLEEKVISRELIRAYLINVLSEEEPKLTRTRKKDLIDIYNNYNFDRFETALAKVRLNTPGLNKVTTKEKSTLLIEACRDGRINYVQALIEKGVKLDLANNKKETAWEAACQATQPNKACQILELLFKEIPQVFHEDKAKELLICAYQQNHPRIFAKILSYINDKNYLSKTLPGFDSNLLVHACKHKNNEYVKLLLNKMVTSESEVNSLAKTLIPYYFQKEVNFGSFKFVIDAITDMTVLNDVHDQETLLTLACSTGDFTNVEPLLNKNVDLFKPNAQGKTPLTIVCEKGYENIQSAIFDKYKENLGGENTKLVEDVAKSLLQLTLDNKHKSIFFNLCEEIKDQNFIYDFYDINFQRIFTNPQFVNDACINQWQDAHLFDYLTLPCNLEKLIELLQNAIWENQATLADRLIHIMREHFQNALEDLLPQLLRVAYEKKYTNIFERLLNLVTNFDIPGLNRIINADQPLTATINKQAAHKKLVLNGHTFLTAACEQERHEIVKLLIAHKEINLELKTHGMSPLQFAVNQGNFAITKTILDGLATNSLNTLQNAIKEGDVLYYAYQRNFKPIFAYLLKLINDLNFSGLDTPDQRLNGGDYLSNSFSKSYNMTLPSLVFYVGELINKGISIPSDMYPGRYGNDRLFYFYFSDLMIFSQHLNSEKDKELLQSIMLPIIHTTDLDEKLNLVKKAVQDKSKNKNYESQLFDKLKNSVERMHHVAYQEVNVGFSLLHKACKQKNNDKFQELIVNENEVNAGKEKDAMNGKTALHYLVAHSMTNPQAPQQITKMLQNSILRQCLDIRDHDGRIPLTYALMQSDLEIASLLVKQQKGNISLLPDRANLQTPLHYACKSRDSNFVKLLIDEPQVKQHINDVDRLGKTALHYVCLNDKNDVIPLLLEQGASCSIQTPNGDTPLHIACRTGNFKTIKTLMNSASFFEALLCKNSDKRTPIDELNHHPNKAEARYISDYLIKLSRLSEHAKALAKKTDIDAQQKASAITNLLQSLCKTDIDGQKRILGDLKIDDEKNPLFKPRNPYHGFFIAAPGKTTTARDVEALRQQLATFK